MCDAGFAARYPRNGFTQAELDAMVRRQAQAREDAQHGTNAPTEHPEESSAPDRAPTGRAGHWTGTEEAQANYLIAAMTGRTPEEVKEPLSRLLHELRYGREDEAQREAVLDGLLGPMATDCGSADWDPTCSCDGCMAYVARELE